MSADKKRQKEFGDFQTPFELAVALCSRLKGSEFKTILEPTCGVGNFAKAALATWPKCTEVLGFDVNADYIAQARNAVVDPRAQFTVASFFVHDWETTLAELPKPLIVIGNLPWVTSSTIGALGGSNLPEKNNFQGRAGFDAITGKANFDISEWMLLKMLDWCERHEAITVALLVKTGVARKVLQQAWQKNRRIKNASITRVDTMQWFNAAVDSCLLVFSGGVDATAPECPVFDVDGVSITSVIGYRNATFIGDTRRYEEARAFLGGSPLRWRSGVKHDCAKVMELDLIDGELINGLDEKVDIEPHYVFPLFKSSQLARGDTHTTRRVIVTQRQVGQPTAEIEQRAPLTWQYLLKHSAALDARGSSIYIKNGRFAIFGVGDYTFAPFKVAISGLYKKPRFVVLHEIEGKPSLVDDTACFLSFQNERDATSVAAALNSPQAAIFLETFAFADAKRPYTVDVLSKINLERLISVVLGPEQVPDSIRNPDAQGALPLN